MPPNSLPSTAAVAGHPIHATLVPFPIVCFTLTLATDITYWQTGVLFWKEVSSWLLLVGLVFGGLAAIFGAIDLLSKRPLRRYGIGWVHGIGNLVALILAFINSLVHAGDGWTSVVPNGLILSTVTVLGMIVTVWLGRSMVYRQAIGVYRHD